MNPASKKLLGLLLAWGALALVAGYFHLLAHLPPVGVQATIAGLTVGFSLALAGSATLDAGATGLGVRPILAFHVTRVVGLYFLWLQAQGRMPAEFAQRAGWGDVAAALTAALLLLWREGPGFRRALLAWNLLGAADLFVAVGTASWLNVTRLGAMAELGHLPLALIPLWLVPMLLGSHFHLVRRTLRDGRRLPPVPAQA